MTMTDSGLYRSGKRARRGLPKPPRPGRQNKIMQFDWSRNWKKKVEPYLDVDLVRVCLVPSTNVVRKGWQWAGGPYISSLTYPYGNINIKRNLSWYQSLYDARSMSFFAFAIGVLNYPELDWQFLCGPCHTVAAGVRGGETRVVMDIL